VIIDTVHALFAAGVEPVWSLVHVESIVVSISSADEGSTLVVVPTTITHTYKLRLSSASKFFLHIKRGLIDSHLIHQPIACLSQGAS